ncbi:hypothetical protein TNCV_519051 [Trichonephila clavipes]|nr:hypothetical protein TNCV_519051 [Trichonephila clavipes]
MISLQFNTLREITIRSGGIINDLLMWPRRKAVVEFRPTTGHNCLLKHLHRIHVAQASFCTLCDIWEDMDADHIHRTAQR